MTIIHKEFLIAWLQGKEVQCKTKNDIYWNQVRSEKEVLSSSSLFSNADYEFRFKPKEQQYRVALMKEFGKENFYTLSADLHYPGDDELTEQTPGFVRWLTDWIPYPVEE